MISTCSRGKTHVLDLSDSFTTVAGTAVSTLISALIAWVTFSARREFRDIEVNNLDSAP